MVAGKGLDTNKKPPELKFGGYCANKCGTYIRRATPHELGQALSLHESDRRKCVNHPDNLKGKAKRKLPRRGV